MMIDDNRFLLLFIGTSLASVYWGCHWFWPKLRIFHMQKHIKVCDKTKFWNILSYHVDIYLLGTGEREPSEHSQQALW